MVSNFGKEMFSKDDFIEEIYQEYVLKKNHEDKVYCFFEGKDDYKYYGSRIKHYTDKQTITRNCNGKDNVLTLYAMIREQSDGFEDKDILFFIDNDFDIKRIQNSEIYVTPCYAIENFYVMDHTLIEFFKSEIGIEECSCYQKDRDDFEKALSFFKKERDKFIERTTLLNTWYSLQKNSDKNIDLTEIKSINKIKENIDLETLKLMTPNYKEFSQKELDNEKDRLLKNPIYNFRGKYYKEFLYEILTQLITDSNLKVTDKNKKIFSKKRKVNLSLGKDNIISILSQYAYTPECLKEYLRERLNYSEELTESV